MIEVEPQRPTHEIHPADDAHLMELASAECEAGLLVPPRDPHLVVQLRSLAQHEVLPVRPSPGLERLKVLGPEENRVSVRTRGDASGTLVPSVPLASPRVRT